MKNRHTPGPWKIMHGIYSDQIGIIQETDQLDNMITPVCLISPADKYDETDAANARLIATAPEMYKFIKGIADGYQPDPAYAKMLITKATKTEEK